ncbi:hypothetical protein OK016_27725 [Vibrio chagasii]|nr:hypothetical protein [Vibrio chagasii]
MDGIQFTQKLLESKSEFSNHVPLVTVMRKPPFLKMKLKRQRDFLWRNRLLLMRY